MTGEIRLRCPGPVEGVLKPGRIHVGRSVIAVLTLCPCIIYHSCGFCKWGCGMAENAGTEGYREDPGCAYILDAAPAGSAAPAYCGVPRQPGSDYCPAHHALCHLRPGGSAEARHLRRLEALAGIVGGRQARPVGPPAAPWLSRVRGGQLGGFASKLFTYCSRGDDGRGKDGRGKDG